MTSRRWRAGTTWLLTLAAFGSALLAQDPPAGGGGAESGAAAPVPVVVAIDTSRSLTRGELRAVGDRLRLALADLPAGTAAGLLAFDDQPRWVRPLGASPAEVGEALAELTPQGSYTLLNDALFVAARELADGGVILLATDGRDESSATTVDDIARRCEAQDVRILALGAGGDVEERSLRRLALLSNGAYLGAAPAVDAATLARAVDTARRGIAAARESAPDTAAEAPGAPDGSPAGAPAADPSAPAAADAESAAVPATDGGWGGAAALLVPALALLLGLGLGWLLWHRARRRTSRAGADALEDDAEELDSALVLELAGRDNASLQEAPEVTVDTAVFRTTSLDERLEKTRVLTDQGVFLVRRSDEAPRLYLLGHDKAFAVGRDRQFNTLALPDPALSAQHFKIVPHDGGYYLVDLGSTNGSFVNGHRSPARRLRSGDVIRAGQVEFEFQSHGDF